jgi:hypothetical protein
MFKSSGAGHFSIPSERLQRANRLNKHEEAHPASLLLHGG